MRCIVLLHRPPTYNSLDRFSHQWGFRRFQPHEARCLLSATNKVYWTLTIDTVKDQSPQQLALG